MVDQDWLIAVLQETRNVFLSVEFLAALLVFIVSSSAGTIGVWLVNRRSATKALIDEFHSPAMVAHRGAIHAMKHAHRNSPPLPETGAISLDYIVRGFCYPGMPHYSGEMQPNGLDEHQNLTVFFGYVTRVSEASRRWGLDAADLRAGIGGSYRWDAGFLRLLVEAAQYHISWNDAAQFPTTEARQMGSLSTLLPQERRFQQPDWAIAVLRVERLLAYDYEAHRKEFDSKHRVAIERSMPVAYLRQVPSQGASNE